MTEYAKGRKRLYKMRYEYNFYITDESFDYGDFPGATVTETVKHGFSVEIDSDNKVDINSLESYGDYSQLQNEIKTLQGLLDYIEAHLSEVEEHDENEIITNYYLFLELTDFLREQIKEEETKKDKEERKVA